MQTLPNPATVKSSSGELSTDTTIHRRQTRPIQVGNVTIGGSHPVVVQSMINEDTLDIDGSVAAIRRLHEIGCEIVRVTVPSMAHAQALAEIKQKLYASYQPVPILACTYLKNLNPIALSTVKQNSRKLATRFAKLWNHW
jgi:(E)-4-hydroxy-3-methylbut-2-enyl-diphosphate synthase